MLRRFSSYRIWIGVALLVILCACSGSAPTQAPEPSLTPAQTPTPSPTPAEIAAVAPEGEAPEPTATPLLGEIIATRVPEPTATPGPLAQEVINYAARAGLATTRFLGLSVADWVNLGLSLVFVVLGYLLGTWVIRRLLPRLVRRTPSTFDDEFFKAIGNSIRWLVALLVLYLSTTRLTFVGANIKTFLEDVYFVLGLFLVVRILWKAVNLATEWYAASPAQKDRAEQLAPILLMITRGSNILIVIIGLTIGLAHFGINVTALTAALGIGGLAISLAAKDTVADAIAGTIILIDQPFRIGDRIEIQGVDTWGDVTSIGLRTTRIRTRDNRLVIVPNSVIGNNQVINYSYPDPRYRIETHVDVAHGTDVETVRRLLIDTVSQVEGVLRQKPVDALYIDMVGPAMRFRVRWWIESYIDTRRMFDRVHTAIQHALDDAGIESPHIADNVNLLVGQEASDRLSRAFRPPGPDSGPDD
jgi:MscS family membrane protein